MKREAEELIEQYLEQVGRYLPARQRADVTAELRSLIADSASGRQADTPELPDRECVAAALRELGEPAVIARRYSARQGDLIGPALYPTFQLLLKVVPAALAGSMAIAWLVGSIHLILAGNFSPRSLAGLIGQMAVWVPWSAGLLVLVFVAMDRWSGLRAGRPWSPAELSAKPRGDEVKTLPMLLGAYLLAALTLWVLFFPDRIGYYWPGKAGGEAAFVPLSALGFVVPVIPLAVVWAGRIALLAVVMRERRWTQLTWFGDAALSAAGGAVLVYGLMLSDPVGTGLARATQWFAYFAIFGAGVDTLKALFKAFAAPQPLTAAQSSPGPAR